MADRLSIDKRINDAIIPEIDKTKLLASVAVLGGVQEIIVIELLQVIKKQKKRDGVGISHPLVSLFPCITGFSNRQN